MITFVSSELGIFKFLDSDGNIYKVGAESESEARSILQTSLSDAYKLSAAKAGKISQFKYSAKSALDATDWKIIRHKEQLELNTLTSLSPSEYIALLESRQAIRDKSNTLESQVNAAETIEQLNGINW